MDPQHMMMDGMGGFPEATDRLVHQGFFDGADLN
jgi:hypothetical protein